MASLGVRQGAAESVNIVFGIFLNSLLLLVIVRCSKPQLGNYRTLLKIFACNDIFMLFLHAIVRPASFSSGSALGVFSSIYPDNRHLIALSSGCFTLPFSIMNINFLHRYWIVRSPYKVELFSKPFALLLFSIYPISMAFFWYCCCISLAGNSVGKAVLERSISSLENVRMADGWLVLHFWENGRLHTRGVITLFFGGLIIASNLSIAAVLCSRTIGHLRREITFSPSYKLYQFKILRALFAQCSIPLIFVYVPAGAGVTLPLFCWDERAGAALDPWFTIITGFPGLDAIVIILLMKDYRDGLVGMFHRAMRAEMSASVSTSTKITENL